VMEKSLTIRFGFATWICLIFDLAAALDDFLATVLLVFFAGFFATIEHLDMDRYDHDLIATGRR
jgi:hypothetical protein